MTLSRVGIGLMEIGALESSNGDLIPEMESRIRSLARVKGISSIWFALSLNFSKSSSSNLTDSVGFVGAHYSITRQYIIVL